MVVLRTIAAAVVVVGVLLGGREDRAESPSSAMLVAAAARSDSSGAASPRNSSSGDDDGFGFSSVSLTAGERAEYSLLTAQGEQRIFMQLVKANLEQRNSFERNTCSLDSSRLYFPPTAYSRVGEAEEPAAAATTSVAAGHPAPRPPKIAVCVVGATRTLVEPGVFVSLKHNLLMRGGPNTHLFMYLMHGKEMSRRGGAGNGATEEQMRYVNTRRVA